MAVVMTAVEILLMRSSPDDVSSKLSSEYASKRCRHVETKNLPY